jgi:hypothetical protein
VATPSLQHRPRTESIANREDDEAEGALGPGPRCGARNERLLLHEGEAPGLAASATPQAQAGYDLPFAIGPVPEQPATGALGRDRRHTTYSATRRCPTPSVPARPKAPQRTPAPRRATALRRRRRVGGRLPRRVPGPRPGWSRGAHARGVRAALRQEGEAAGLRRLQVEGGRRRRSSRRWHSSRCAKPARGSTAKTRAPRSPRSSPGVRRSRRRAAKPAPMLCAPTTSSARAARSGAAWPRAQARSAAASRAARRRCSPRPKANAAGPTARRAASSSAQRRR